jgi:hypothetical protein
VGSYIVGRVAEGAVDDDGGQHGDGRRVAQCTEALVRLLREDHIVAVVVVHFWILRQILLPQHQQLLDRSLHSTASLWHKRSVKIVEGVNGDLILPHRSKRIQARCEQRSSAGEEDDDLGHGRLE